MMNVNTNAHACRNYPEASTTPANAAVGSYFYTYRQYSMFTVRFT